MASSSTDTTSLEAQLEQTEIRDAAEDHLFYGSEGENEESPDGEENLCLVGRFLTTRILDFRAIQHKMASLWQPGKGICIKELEPNLLLFQFYHEVDMERVIEGSPWTFDRVPLIFERLPPGGDPSAMRPNKLDFWVQLHGLVTGFKSERVVHDLGNYIGTFVQSDPNNFKGLWRDYLRVRVSFQIDKPLKIKMKLEKANGLSCHVHFRYEDLPTFCFICGLLGHSERFCHSLFTTPKDQIVKPYGLFLKAAPRRRHHTIGERWLRNEDGSPWRSQEQFPTDSEEQDIPEWKVKSQQIIRRICATQQ